jgi:hypothetical protein
MPKDLAPKANTNDYCYISGKDFEKLHFSFFVPDDESSVEKLSSSSSPDLKYQRTRYKMRRAYKQTLQKNFNKEANYTVLKKEFEELGSCKFSRDLCAQSRYTNEPLTNTEKLCLARDVFIENINRLGCEPSMPAEPRLQFYKEASETLGIPTIFSRELSQLFLNNSLKVFEANAKSLPSLNQIFYALATQWDIEPTNIGEKLSQLQNNLYQEYEEYINEKISNIIIYDDILEIIKLENSKSHRRFLCLPKSERFEIFRKLIIDKFYYLLNIIDRIDDRIALEKLFKKLFIYDEIKSTYLKAINEDYYDIMAEKLKSINSAIDVGYLYNQYYPFIDDKDKFYLWNKNNGKLFSIAKKTIRYEQKRSDNRDEFSTELHALKQLKKTLKENARIKHFY